jgi:hypothetical protein
MSKLKRKHIRALQNAIHEAADCRAWVAAERRAEWDTFIATAQEGLNIIKKERKNERTRTDSRVG